MRNQLIRLALLLALFSNVHRAAAQGTAFTYQGRLNDGANPANGDYDLKFSLFDGAGGGSAIQIGPFYTNSATAVSNGYFTIALDFGPNFPGADRWLEIAVRTNGAVSFATLVPRQKLTPVPYAVFSSNAGSAATALAAANATLATSANTFSGPLGGDVTGTQAATVVSAVGGASAASVALGATAANAATSASVPNAIVKRDANGNLAAADIVNSNLHLPATTSASGVIYSGNQTLLHTYGLQNFFAGVAAGNLTMTGSNNTAVGSGAFRSGTTGSDNSAFGLGALASNTAGSLNTAVGRDALELNTTGFANVALGLNSMNSNSVGSFNTALGSWALFENSNGSNNTASGYYALLQNRSGHDNTANGANALYGNTSGSYNTAIGEGTLFNNTDGVANTALGYEALYFNAGSYNTAVGYAALELNTTGLFNSTLGSHAMNSNSLGSFNTAIGNWALFENLVGSNNTAIGYQALYNNSGNNNLAEGYQAGFNLNAGSNNIIIGNPGLAGDNNTIRLGTPGVQTTALIAGIYGATASNGLPVFVNSSGQLGSGGTIALSALPGAVLTNGASGASLGGAFNGNGAGLTNVNAATLGGNGPAAFWQTIGNHAGSAGSNFLGTLDNAPLELRVNNQKALRLEPTGGIAAGQQAVAAQSGEFVWADAAGYVFDPFAQSGPQGVANSYNVRATGGFFVTTAVDGSGGITSQFQISPNGFVGIGAATTQPGFPLDVTGRTRIRDGAGGPAGIWLNTANGFGVNGLADIGLVGAMDATRIGFYGNDPRGGSGWGLTFDTVTGNVGIGTGANYPAARLQVNGGAIVNGNATVCTLTITGGCDLSEPFNVSSAEVPKGALMIIDQRNPGKLRLSENAYDHRVAGIISGANGINPAISMQQTGLAEGGQNVALSGRVFALAEATSGAIEPGDLLTTSDTPGHCMKVTDHTRAQGAIVGKAMSPLAGGKGMVLVLVSLQ